MPLRAATALLLTMATLPALSAPDVPQLQKMSSRLAPVDIRVDVSALPENERQALTHIIQAAQILDAVFLKQVFLLATLLAVIGGLDSAGTRTRRTSTPTRCCT